ncbi:MAG: DUF1559 domain-containing protein [Planctomycetaceae bacterium]|nr:DUF1559 domain-containing protein [Planctomycetaceae bacterium]MBT6483638.1 DUF1559 domain-containing protein [Planctomycetaceae bacterium]MBT6494966.1 DUF1559 domain-containing protein [Planctomycetaceae bacterium]
MRRLAIVLLFGTIVGCGIGQAREAARRSQCKNNLKQIGLALHNYHDEFRSFPPAFVADENGTPMHSWRVLLLPYLDHQKLYDQYDLSQPWDSPANQAVLNNMPAIFACPSGTPGNTTNYAGVFGADCIFTGAEVTKVADCKDGLSNTLVVGEVDGSAIPWTKPEDIDISKYPDLSDPAGFHSSHTGGMHFLLADGSVRFVSEQINPQTLKALFTRDGEEIVGEF